MNLIITGACGSGKTSLCEKFVANQLGCGRKVAGLLSLRCDDTEQFNGSYEFYDISSGEAAPFFSGQPTPPKREATLQSVNEKALAFARTVLETALMSDNEIIAIDEYGDLEMQGERLASLANAIIRSGRDAVIVVPFSHLKDFIDSFPDQRFGVIVSSELTPKPETRQMANSSPDSI